MEAISRRKIFHYVCLALILLASLELKLRLLPAVEQMKLQGDELTYVRMGEQWALGNRYVLGDGNTTLWPPGFVTFLGLYHPLDDGDPVRPLRGQIYLATLTVAFVYIIARALLKRPALALAAAAAVAFYPTLVAFSHYFFAETLYLFFYTGAAAAYLTGVRREQAGWFVLAGVAFALAALTKAIGLYTAIPWIVWHLWYTGRPGVSRAAGRAALFTGVAVACILPWTYRNYLEFERFVPIDITLGLNMYLGHNLLEPPNYDYGIDKDNQILEQANRPQCIGEPGLENPKDIDRCEVRNALEFIRENPGLTLERLPVKMADLFAPTSFLVRKLRMDAYELPSSSPLKYRVMAAAIFGYMAVMVGAVMAFTLLPSDRWRPFVLGLVLYYVAVHWATWGMSRFRLTLEPFLIILAIEGWRYGPGSLMRSRGIGWRPLAFYLLMGVVILFWSDRLDTGLTEVLEHYL